MMKKNSVISLPPSLWPLLDCSVFTSITRNSSASSAATDQKTMFMRRARGGDAGGIRALPRRRCDPGAR